MEETAKLIEVLQHCTESKDLARVPVKYQLEMARSRAVAGKAAVEKTIEKIVYPQKGSLTTRRVKEAHKASCEATIEATTRLLKIGA